MVLKVKKMAWFSLIEDSSSDKKAREQEKIEKLPLFLAIFEKEALSSV